MNKKQLPATFYKSYKAHIADVDGNLTDENEYATTLLPDIIQRIRNHLTNGILFGICSVRSFRPNELMDNIQKAITFELPDNALHKFFLFPEQGSTVISYKRDSMGQIQTHEQDLVSLFNITDKPVFEEQRNTLFQYLSSHPALTDVLSIVIIKKYGFIMKIKRQENLSDEAYKRFVKQTTTTINSLLAQKYPHYEASCSRTSVGVFIKGANKSLALRYMAQQFHLSIDEIVGTDDQCTPVGVGWPLTRHKAGFSTNQFDEQMPYPTPLKPLCGYTGKEAWLFLDDNLTYIAQNT